MTNKTDDSLRTIIFLAVASLLIRILLSPMDGYINDLSCFAAWFYTASSGIADFYQRVWCDYPPLNVIIFWVFGNIAEKLSLFNTPQLVYILKFPSALFDVGVAFLIFIILRRMNSDLSSAATIYYLFNPAMILNTSIWGQFDAIYIFFIVASLLLLFEEKYEFSAGVFALAVLTKPQAFAFSPIIIYLLLKKGDLRRILQSFLTFTLVCLPFILYFGHENPLKFLLDVYLGGYGEYPFTSLNAFNVWAFVGLFEKDTVNVIPHVSYQSVGWMMFALSILIVVIYLDSQYPRLRGSAVSYFTFIIFLSFFMFLTRMHERYLVPVIALSLIALPYTRKLLYVYAAFTLTATINQAYALNFLNRGVFIPKGDLVSYAVSLINLTVTLYSFYLVMEKELEGEGNLKEPQRRD